MSNVCIFEFDINNFKMIYYVKDQGVYAVFLPWDRFFEKLKMILRKYKN